MDKVTVAAKIDVKLGATQVLLPPIELKNILIDNGGPISLDAGETRSIAVDQGPPAATYDAGDSKPLPLSFVLVVSDASSKFLPTDDKGGAKEPVNLGSQVQYWIAPAEAKDSEKGAEKEPDDKTRIFTLEYPHFLPGQGAVKLLSASPEAGDFTPHKFVFRNNTQGIVSVAVYLGRKKPDDSSKSAAPPAATAKP